jgi:hypothetical protein
MNIQFLHEYGKNILLIKSQVWLICTISDSLTMSKKLNGLVNMTKNDFLKIITILG